MTRWGIVATIKAPRQDVLNFAAYHLHHGASRLYIYLDEPDAALAVELSARPEIDVVQCDAAWWDKRGKRPDKHQARQVRNARHAYNRRVEVDWLAHIDVDEFIVADAAIDETLGQLPDACACARIRPMEALAGKAGLFKAFHRDHAARNRAVRAIYPNYGTYLRGGFLSHVAGKLFYRTGIEGLRAKIHNIHVGGDQNPGEVDLQDMALAHLHAVDWEQWYSHFRYRHDRGSYRAELKGRGGVSPHALFAAILEEGGEAALRGFFDEVVAATPEHVAALKREGLLREVDLGLDEARKDWFGV